MLIEGSKLSSPVADFVRHLRSNPWFASFGHPVDEGMPQLDGHVWNGSIELPPVRIVSSR